MNEALNILCLEDSPRDAEIIRELLTDAGYHLNMDCTAVEKEFVSFLRSNRYDIILADFKLPGFDGFTALRWSIEICPDVPFICISGTIGEETAVELLKKGAFDYILKDRLVRLPSAVQRALEQHRMQIEKRATELLLKENEERFLLAMKASKDGLFDWNLETNEIYYSPGWKKMLGYEEHELRNDFSVWEKATDPEDVKKSWELYQKLITKQIDRYVTEFKMKHKDGHWVDILAQAEAFFNDSGKAVRMVGTHTDISERKRAEEALHASEEKHRTLIEQSIDGIVISDEHGNVSVWNKRMESITGIQQGETIGRPLWEIQLQLIPVEQKTPELLGQLRNGLKNILESKMEWTGESREQTIIDVNGTHKVVQDSSFIIKTNSKKYFGSIIRDISERKQAEEKLKENYSRLNLAMQSANMAWWEMDISTGMVVFEKRKAEMLGHAPEKFNHYKDFMALVHPDDSDKAMNAMRKHLDGTVEKYEVEYRILNNSGEYKWFYDIGSIVKKDSEGKPLKVTGLVMDITGKKQAETALRVSEEKYRRIFENVHDVFYETSMDGTIIEVSPSINILSKGQYRRHELIGKPMNDFYADPKQRIALLHILREHGFVSDYEITLKNRDGTKIPCSISAKIIFDSGDRPERINGTMRDITDRKLAEENLKNSEERFKILFEYAPDAYYLNDLKGNLIDGNIAAEKLLGIERKELIGKSFLNLKLVSANQIPKAAALLLKNVLGQSTGPDEFVLHRKDGSKVTVEIITHPVKIQGKLLVLGIARDITERKRAEEAVHVKDWVIKSAINAIVTSDMEGKLNYVNPAFLKLWGYNSPEEVLGKPAVGFWQMGEKAAEVVEAVRTKGGWIGELVARKKDGDFFDVQVAASLVMNDTGQPVCLHASFADITERKKMELELAQKNNALSKLNRFSLELSNLPSDSNLQALIAEQVKDIASADVAVFSEYDSSTRTTTPKHIAMDSGLLEKVVGLLGKQVHNVRSVVSDEMYRVMTTEMIGIKKTLYEASFGAIPRSVGAAIQGLLKVDRIIGIAYLIEGKLYGTSILLMGKGQPDPPREILENFVHLAAASLRRKQAEDVLLESEEKFRSIMENSADAIFVTDQQGKYVYTNSEVTAMLGYTSEEMKKKTFIDLSPQNKSDECFEIFKRVLIEGKVFAEIELLKKDGNFISTDLHSALLPGGLVYGSCRDITEKKKVQKELLEKRDYLEELVNERTEELSKAKKDAEEANNAKSEFLANMSHEIRTPMNAVLGYADLLGSSLEDKTQKEYAEFIKSSGRSLLTLINDILDLSKIEAGKLELEFDYINTNFFFSEFEKIFSMKISEKELKFILDITSGTPAGIYVDETCLRQIMFNLIGNAIKFTEKGHVKITTYVQNHKIISYEKGRQEEYIDFVIEVEDTGIGISDEFQKQIFNPFTQQSGQKKYGGTGLGLAITKRLIGLMNGTISINSELDKGSTFQIILPKIAFLRVFGKEGSEIQLNTRDIEFEKASILIADDNESNRKYVIDALKNTNISILEAADGQLAYMLAKEKVPDLIITDIRMANMNGFELLDKLKQDDKLEHIPVIAYSASVMKYQKKNIHKSKFAGLLIKPVSVTELFLALMNHLPYKTDRKIELAKTAEEVNLANGISDLAGLINSMETTLMDIWKTFADRQPINEIMEFGRKLIGLGTEYDATFITGYGEELVSAADSFNIKAISKLLKKYPSIVEDLKDSVPKNKN